MQRNGDLIRGEFRVIKGKSLGIIMAIPKGQQRINKSMHFYKEADGNLEEEICSLVITRHRCDANKSGSAIIV